MRTQILGCALAALLWSAGCAVEEGVDPILIDPIDPTDTTIDDNFTDDEPPDDDAGFLDPMDACVIVSLDTADNDHDGNLELYARNATGGFTSLSAPLGPEADVADYEYVPPGAAGSEGFVLFVTADGVYRTPADRAEPERLSAAADTAGAKVRAADGGTVVYDAGNPRYIVATGPDGGGHRILTPEGGVREWDLAADDELVYSGDADEPGQYELRAMHLDGTGDRRFSGTAAPSGSLRTVRFLVSPTGTHVLFRSDALVPGEYELFVTDLTGPPVLIEGAGSTLPILDAVWGPKGESILVLKRLPGGERDLLHATPAGGPATNLTADFDGRVESYGFSPDGTRCAFRADLGDLYTCDFVAAPVHFLHSGLVNGFAFNPDGDKLAVLASDSLRPPYKLLVGDPDQALSAAAASEPDEDVLAVAWMGGPEDLFVVSDRVDTGRLAPRQDYGAVIVHRRTIDSFFFPEGVGVEGATASWTPVEGGGLVGMTAAEVYLAVEDEELTASLRTTWTRPDGDLEAVSEAECWSGNDVGSYSGATPGGDYLLDAEGRFPHAARPLLGRNFVGIGTTFSNQTIQFKVLATLISLDPVACLVFATQYRRGFGAQPSRGTCTPPITSRELQFASEWLIDADGTAFTSLYRDAADCSGAPATLTITNARFVYDTTVPGSTLDVTDLEEGMFDVVDPPGGP